LRLQRGAPVSFGGHQTGVVGPFVTVYFEAIVPLAVPCPQCHSFPQFAVRSTPANVLRDIRSHRGTAEQAVPLFSRASSLPFSPRCAESRLPHRALVAFRSSRSYPDWLRFPGLTALRPRDLTCLFER